MDNSQIVLTGTDDPRVDSRLIASQLSIRHKNVISHVEKYLTHFKQFGLVPFKTEKPLPNSLGGRPEKYALLTEDQTYFLLSLSRNSDQVVDLKARLVMAFREARQAVDVAKTEYLPSYHALHDQIHELAAQSSNERFVHLNFNRLINKAVGVGSGERSSIPVPHKSLLITAQYLAAQAMRSAQDHKEGYQSAKTALESFKGVVQIGAKMVIDQENA